MLEPARRGQGRPVPFRVVGWRRRSTRRRDADIPASTFDGSDATPSPYTDPDRNWVDLFTIISGSLLDPSRLSNRLYQRRIGLVAGLLFLVDGALAYSFGASWLALGLVLIGVTVYAVVRFIRVPMIALWTVLSLVILVVLPLGLGNGHSAASGPLTCQWLSTSEVSTTLGSGATEGASPTTTHCMWTSRSQPSGRHLPPTELSVVITYPTVDPSPAPSDREISTVGERAWSGSHCGSSTCTETLFVVLSNGFLSIARTSQGVDPSEWWGGTARVSQQLIHLGALVAARASPPP